MKLGAVLVLSLMLAACATAPVAPPSALFEDSAFAPPSERIDADDIFAVSAEMKQFIDTRIEPNATSGVRQALLDALEVEGQLKLEYDAEFTRDAAQAFAARSGNCLSLVVMTAAFAKALDLKVRYHDVRIEETWGRDGHIYFSIGHVNVTVSDRGFSRNSGESTIDFLPPRDVSKESGRLISEQTVVAMYMNNRAVESLVRGRVDDAYWWAREAIAQEPSYMSAYNTLGAVYERRGMPANAEKLFTYVMQREPSNLHVMSNLVAALSEQGRVAEANALSQVMKARDPNPPFSFFNRGLAAMKDGDYARARDLFEKEIDRAPYYHEFHFWLAAAYVGLGDYRHAREHLKIAMENSTTRRDHDLYAAKFAWVAAHSVR
ncbi:MAG TPA: tetratricopeptide repeat protein [Casimicrobiaceae bacterium]|jgi:Tfp pilus assembly protein PilF